MATMTRKGFLTSAACATAAATLGTAAAPPALAGEAAPSTTAGLLTPGTYTDEQDTSYARVLVSCTFDATGLANLTYEVLESSPNDYFVPFADAAAAYCDAIVQAGTSRGVDTITGASLCSKAIADGFENCLYQALGVNKKVGPDFVTCNPQDLSIFHAPQTDLSHVFSPLQVGPMTLQTRVAKSCGSATWSVTDETMLQPTALDYYGTMAENGVSLLVIATGRGILKGVFRLGEGQERPADDVIIEAAKPLMDRIHAAGSYVGMQLTMGFPMGDGANEMTIEEIQAKTKEISEHALIMKKMGCDFVELKGSSGDALNAFYSRRANKRDDEYGAQNFENRTRMFRDLIVGVRESCGESPDVVVVATGGVREHRLESTDGVEVLSMEQGFGTPAAEEIVIVGVGVQAIDMANFLMAQDKKIAMVNEGGIVPSTKSCRCGSRSSPRATCTRTV